MILILTAVAAPMLICLFMWPYVMFNAISAARALRNGRLTEEELEVRCSQIYGGACEQLEKANGSMVCTLWSVLVLIVLLWLCGTNDLQPLYLSVIPQIGYAGCAMYVLYRLTRAITLMMMPSGVSCRGEVVKAYRRGGGGFLMGLMLYGIAYWFLSI